MASSPDKKVVCTSCEQSTDFDAITDGINSVVLEDTTFMCAECGKAEDGNNSLKFCIACKMVKYCNRDCQVKHRPKHKKDCKKRAAEIYDEKLFKEAEPEECPICFQPFEFEETTQTYQECCGKTICNGCLYSTMPENGGSELCPFCRMIPPKTSKGIVEQTMKLMKNGNAAAYEQLGIYYLEGTKGMPKDGTKAHEMWLKAGELGHHGALFNLAVHYRYGMSVGVDEKKSKHYYELAAMGGNIYARHALGCLEGNAGNHKRAMKHFILGARSGEAACLGDVKTGYTRGFVTKDEYATTLRAFHERQKEMKSDARDKVAAIIAKKKGKRCVLTSRSMTLSEWRQELVKGDQVKVAGEKDRLWKVVSINEDRSKLELRDESCKLPNIYREMNSIRPS